MTGLALVLGLGLSGVGTIRADQPDGRFAARCAPGAPGSSTANAAVGGSRLRRAPACRRVAAGAGRGHRSMAPRCRPARAGRAGSAEPDGPRGAPLSSRTRSAPAPSASFAASVTATGHPAGHARRGRADRADDDAQHAGAGARIGPERTVGGPLSISASGSAVTPVATVRRLRPAGALRSRHRLRPGRWITVACQGAVQHASGLLVAVSTATPSLVRVEGPLPTSPTREAACGPTTRPWASTRSGSSSR